MNQYTFLSEEEIEKLGSERVAVATDYTKLLGLNYNNQTGHCYYWTKTDDNNYDAIAVSPSGNTEWFRVNARTAGARPAFPFSAISSISSNIVRGQDGELDLIYGEYPQTVAPYELQEILTAALKDSGREFGISNHSHYSLEHDCTLITEKKYTIETRSLGDYGDPFVPLFLDEIIYQGTKYVQLIAKTNCVLSDGNIYHEGSSVWVKVEPVHWKIYEEFGFVLSKKVLFSGIAFHCESNYEGDFEKTDIKKYLDQYFSKEIIDSKQKLIKPGLKKNKAKNPYHFAFEKISEEDGMKGAIESGISVFLHGRSSEGKSARVKQLDPDCEIVYMRNATPDSLNGKSVYNPTTGEMMDIPPTWYTRLVEKCEKEPNKIHILFLDEITNALPSIQGMAFNIVLDHEVNGKWKLPSNVRIVAAGNEVEDSLSANELAEPLFNRFAHIYIHTTVNSWLKWAVTKEESYERLDYNDEQPEAKIHPSIYSYIAYKSYSGNDVLRTTYTGKTPNADPRKWEMASKVLYKTKNPYMLKALIGEELTMDFVSFVSRSIIKLEDVLNHNYTDEDLLMDVSEKFATAAGLSTVGEEDFEVVREFMKKIGAEPKAAFESMWAHGDEKRLEYLLELKMMEQKEQGGITR